jgi:hypothetical protein
MTRGEDDKQNDVILKKNFRPATSSSKHSTAYFHLNYFHNGITGFFARTLFPFLKGLVMRTLLLCLIAALSLSPGSIAAQEVSTKEAGAYARKSITYINTLWLMDESVRRLPPEKVAVILDKIKQAVFMPRFDYNPVPESLVNEFAAQANQIRYPYVNEAINTAGGTDPMLDSVATVMERTVVPGVLAIVDLNKELRAANLTSEQQRNSFIADKAKTMGITMEDVEKVMNSAYIFVPLLRGYTAELRDSSYTAGVSAGIIWFSISTKGDRAVAVPVVKNFTYSSGFSVKDRRYATEAGFVDYKEFAFRTAVKNAARNLAVATQQIADFRLSGQVIDKGFMGVGVNLGKREGLKVDDKYQIVESFEEADGKTTTKKNGWIMVTSVADSNSKQGYKSKAQVIAGDPYTGAVLSEYPRLPLDIVIRGRMFSFKVGPDTTDVFFDSLTLNNGYGAGLDIQYNIGRGMGLNQFFFGLSGGFGIGSVSGYKNSTTIGGFHDRARVSTAWSWCAELSLIKKFYIGRVAIVLQPTVGYQSLILMTDKSTTQDEYYSLTNGAIGFAANGGLEIALSPSVNLGLGAGYQFYGTSSSWEYSYKKGTDGNFSKIATIDKGSPVDYTGIVAQVCLVWSLPSIAFDPLDMVQGVAGGIK